MKYELLYIHALLWDFGLAMYSAQGKVLTIIIIMEMINYKNKTFTNVELNI